MFRLFPILVAAGALAVAGPLAAASPMAGPAPGASQPPSAAPADVPAAPRQTATRIPEPDTIALFLLGAVGLVVGRRMSRSRRTRMPDA